SRPASGSARSRRRTGTTGRRGCRRAARAARPAGGRGRGRRPAGVRTAGGRVRGPSPRRPARSARSPRSAGPVPPRRRPGRPAGGRRARPGWSPRTPRRTPRSAGPCRAAGAARRSSRRRTPRRAPARRTRCRAPVPGSARPVPRRPGRRPARRRRAGRPRPSGRAGRTGPRRRRRAARTSGRAGPPRRPRRRSRRGSRSAGRRGRGTPRPRPARRPPRPCGRPGRGGSRGRRGAVCRRGRRCRGTRPSGLASSLEGTPVWLTDSRSWEDSVGYLRAAAALTGRGEQQAEAEQAFYDKLAEAQAAAEEEGFASVKPLVLYGSDGAFQVDSEGSIVGGLLDEVVDYDWEDRSTGGHQAGGSDYSIEEILAGDPDVIFVESFTFSEDDAPLSEQLAEDPVWKRIGAVEAGRVHEVDLAPWATGRGTRSL